MKYLGTFLLAAAAAFLLPACAKQGLSVTDQALRSASSVAVVQTSSSVLFASIAVHLGLQPPLTGDRIEGKGVTVRSLAGKEDFAVLYTPENKAFAALLPLNGNDFQLVSDPALVSAFAGKVSSIESPAPRAESGSSESASSGSGGGGLSGSSGGHSAWGIKVGMSKSEVQRLKGAPDQINGDLWIYMPLAPAADLSTEGSGMLAAQLPFGSLFANSAAKKVSPKRKKYCVYFIGGDSVSNVVVESF